MWKLLVLLIASGLLLLTIGAATATVTTSVTPALFTITNTPSSWAINGITGSSTGLPNTKYYANPLGDTVAPSAVVLAAECYFTVDPTGSSQNVDLAVTFSDFTGGSAAMTNSNLGTNGATTFGGYSWYTGMVYANKVIMKATGSSLLKDEQDKATALKWGAEILTRTNSFTGTATSTATMTITGTVD